MKGATHTNAYTSIKHDYNKIQTKQINMSAILYSQLMYVVTPRY